MNDSELDPEAVAFFLNKRVLVGLTYLNAAYEVVSQKQVYGVIVKIDLEGIKISHPENGGEFILPCDFDAFKAAAPGEYRLRSTGEVVTDPDFLVQYEIFKPA